MGIGSPRHRIRVAWRTAVVVAALVGAPNALGDALVPGTGVTAPPPAAPAPAADVAAVPAATAAVATAAPSVGAAPAPVVPTVTARHATAKPKPARAASPVRTTTPAIPVAGPVERVALPQSVRRVALPLTASHAVPAPPAVSRRGPQVRQETGTTSLRRFHHRRAAPSGSTHHRAAPSARRLPQAVHGVATLATPARTGQRGVAARSASLSSRPLSVPSRPLPVPPPPSPSSLELMSSGAAGFQLLLLFTCLTAVLAVALPRRGPRTRQRRSALPRGCYGRLLERPG
jgi:hypothetical protein